MEGGGRRRRRSYTSAYKAEVVQLCLAGERSVAAVANDLGIAQRTVQSWVGQAEGEAVPQDRLTPSEREELARLRKENRVLREERDILKRAMAFFAKETR
jgi:transposase